MNDIVERLNENIISDAFERRAILDGALCERLIRERKEAAETIEKLRREAAIRIDQIEREQEAHLKTMADLYYQAEMNARLLTENASFRGEIEKLRRDVKTAVMGDSAELADVKRENEKLREALTDAAGELQHAYIMGFTERYRDAAKAARAAAAAIRESEAKP